MISTSDKHRASQCGCQPSYQDVCGTAWGLSRLCMEMQQMHGNANAGVATGRAGTNLCFKKGAKTKIGDTQKQRGTWALASKAKKSFKQFKS